jgi:uncharacterized membrane protein
MAEDDVKPAESSRPERTPVDAGAADHALEVSVGNLLRAGVILAATVVVVGGVVFLARYGGDPARYQVFAGEPAELRHLPGILRGALAGRGRGVIQLGLVLLIATPIARVVLAGVAFARRRDRLYTLVTATVLALLAYSLFGRHP